MANENDLRGVQETAADGTVTFASIFPAAYAGRWPHIHDELYPSLTSATSAGNKIGTSQIAMPEETCDLVFATSGYEQSVHNLAQTSLSTDNVFSDGWTTQLATVSGCRLRSDGDDHRRGVNPPPIASAQPQTATTS